jgi:hypothetical protein
MDVTVIYPKNKDTNEYPGSCFCLLGLKEGLESAICYQNSVYLGKLSRITVLNKLSEFDRSDYWRI